MRFLFFLLLAAACSAPCPLVCDSDLACPPGFYCLNRVACLQDCVHCANGCLGTPSNCSNCGVPCPAGQRCSLGKCQDACDAGLDDCSGTCTNLKIDRLNCGTCGTACARDENCVAVGTADSGPQGKCIKVDVCQ